MTNSQTADPRPSYAAATAWVTELLNGVSEDQWSAPTPCLQPPAAATSRLRSPPAASSPVGAQATTTLSSHGSPPPSARHL